VAQSSANSVRLVADDGTLFISDSTVRGTDGNCIWVDAATAPRVFIVNTNIQSATSSIGVAIGNGSLAMRASSVSACVDGIYAFASNFSPSFTNIDLESSNVTGSAFYGIWAVSSSSVSVHDSVIAETGTD